MKLVEASNALYGEIKNFATHNLGDHSYENFKFNSSSYIDEKEYSNIYWTLVYTKEIEEGPNAPPKKEQTEIIPYLTQRVNQLQKMKSSGEKKASKENFSTGYGYTPQPKEDKTGIYNQYKVSNTVPTDLIDSFSGDDIEVSEETQTAREIFAEMNAYVASVMQKQSTKPHMIICGAPGIGKTTEIENNAPKYLLPGWKIVSVSGTIGNAPRDIVPFFYKHSQNKIIILDDVNTIFRTNYKDPVLTFLMAVLDKKASTTKPVKINKSQINDFNKQLEDMEESSFEIFIDRNKLKEGVLSIQVDNKEIFNDLISLQESKELFNMIKPSEEKIIKNKFGFLREVTHEEYLDEVLNDESGDYDYSDLDGDDESPFDSTQIPERWTFNSRVIMVTNLKMAAINQAFRERCLVYYIELSIDQYIERLETVLPNLLKDDLDISDEILNWAKKYTFESLSRTLKAFKHDYAIPYSVKGNKKAVSIEINRDLTFRLFEELVQRWLVFATRQLGNNIKIQSTREDISKKLIKPFIITYIVPFLKSDD